MTTALIDALSDLDTWQAALDSQQAVFAAMLPGASIGIIPKRDLQAPGGKMLVWEAQQGRIVAEERGFSGIRSVGVDLLFVADDEAIEALRTLKGSGALEEMKEFIRQGNILFYVLKTKDDLTDLGFEEFLEALGLAFAGPCR